MMEEKKHDVTAIC